MAIFGLGFLSEGRLKQTWAPKEGLSPPLRIKGRGDTLSMQIQVQSLLEISTSRAAPLQRGREKQHVCIQLCACSQLHAALLMLCGVVCVCVSVCACVCV